MTKPIVCAAWAVLTSITFLLLVVVTTSSTWSDVVHALLFRQEAKQNILHHILTAWSLAGMAAVAFITLWTKRAKT